MKLALVTRDMETHNKPSTPNVPGRVLNCHYDYADRQITFIVEHELAPEAPTLIEIVTVDDNGYLTAHDVTLPNE